jgi:hypothetical protein
MTKKAQEFVDRGLTLDERRAFMKLSFEERRRQMANQAAELAASYEDATKAALREEWQGGDILELA